MTNNKDRAAKVITGLHAAIFKASKGRVLGRTAGMPVVMLTTTGRKSGQPRTTMLTSPLMEDASIVLVASYGGDPRHPSWFLNLRDNPSVEVTTEGRTLKMVARVADATEKAQLWPRITATYKGYAGYQTKTDRDIPVVVLDPA